MITRGTVTLEFLRRGLAHNQLLSPVTDYLAVCGNHEAVSVQVPFEHWEFLDRMRDMRYQTGDDQSRRRSLRTVAEDVERILRQVPGLIAELDPPTGDADLTHVRLVLSAAELALIPFELALSPQGCPGAGQNMLLQTSAPITMTREVRRASSPTVEWPKRPRILFAAASPTGAGPIPLRAHLLELRHAIDPWVMPGDDDAETLGRVQELLTVLPQASLESIREECAKVTYTHVHILAHGAPVKDEVHDGFGLALCDRRGQGLDVVSGRRLADALRAHKDTCRGDMSRPAVVTIASCDAGNVRDVITPGASLAHALHLADIPFVVASQFPLTVPGSVLLVRVLYRRLLRGDDPRLVLHDLRQQLHQLDRQSHDWASVVAYASLPGDFDDQLRVTCSTQARFAMAVGMAKADRSVKVEAPKKAEEGVNKALDQLAEALACMPEKREVRSALLVSGATSQTEELGLCGSAEKRRAQGYYFLATQAQRDAIEAKASNPDAPRAAERSVDAYKRREREALVAAREHYREAFLHDMKTHWAIVQYLCLSVVMQEEPEREYWDIARSTAQLETRSNNRVHQEWAHASLVELALLEAERCAMTDPARHAQAEQTFYEEWERFRRLVKKGSHEWVSTERQLRRYTEWWPTPVAKKLVLNVLPPTSQAGPGSSRAE
jgi:hypothetical protein